MLNTSEFIDKVRHREAVSAESISLFGRLDRVLVTETGDKLSPVLLTTRPTKKVSFDMPLSFVMGPKLLSNIPEVDSLVEFLSSVIGLEATTINNRIALIKAGKLDHVLMIFSDAEVPVQSASVEGIANLLEQLDGRVSERFRKVLPALQDLKGVHNFQRRIDDYSSYWDQWYECSQCMWLGVHVNYPACGCKHDSFSDFIRDFDDVYMHEDITEALLVTRRMMSLLLRCNKYFGMDGFVYNSSGDQVGQEYLALNTTLDKRNERGEHAVTTLFLSEFDRFKVID